VGDQRRTGWLFFRGGRRRVTEAELDMNRQAIQSPGLVNRVRGALFRLVPNGGSIGPPTRSVDRELQDQWPGNG